MDLLYGLQGATADSVEDTIIEDEIANAGANDFPVPEQGQNSGRMPTPADLLNILDEMTGLSDEDRESLREELTRSASGENPAGQPVATLFSSQALILFALLALVALIFGAICVISLYLRIFPFKIRRLSVFIGYKLYKSLVEREKKREEKKKLKQMKKKK